MRSSNNNNTALPPALVESEANKSMFYEFDYTQEQNKNNQKPKK